MMKHMYSLCSEHYYFDFGVLKVCKDFNLYNRCMIQNILHQSYLNLSEIVPTEQDIYIKESLEHIKQMENILSEMQPWLALSNVHLDIAITYMKVETPDKTKAKHHFKMALEKSELPSRYWFTAYKHYIKFCIDQGNEEDVKFAELISKELLRRATKAEQKGFVKQSLKELYQKKPRTLSADYETDSCPSKDQQEEIIYDRQQHRQSNSKDGNVEDKDSTKNDTESAEHINVVYHQNKREELDKDRLRLEMERLQLDRQELQQKQERLQLEKCRLELNQEQYLLEKERHVLEREKLELDRKILQHEKERFKGDKQNDYY